MPISNPKRCASFVVRSGDGTPGVVTVTDVAPSTRATSRPSIALKIEAPPRLR